MNEYHYINSIWSGSVSVGMASKTEKSLHICT